MSRILIIGDIGKFNVSETGEVYHFDLFNRKHKLTPFINKRGYYDFYVRSKNKRKHLLLHRLLAMAYIPNPNNLPIVRHLDGNPLNNNLNNLVWGTQKENMQDRKQHKTDNGGERSGSAKLTWKIVRIIRGLIKRKCPVTQHRLAEFFDVKQPTISDIVRKITWQEC